MSSPSDNPGSADGGPGPQSAPPFRGGRALPPAAGPGQYPGNAPPAAGRHQGQYGYSQQDSFGEPRGPAAPQHGFGQGDGYGRPDGLSPRPDGASAFPARQGPQHGYSPRHGYGQQHGFTPSQDAAPPLWPAPSAPPQAPGPFPGPAQPGEFAPDQRGGFAPGQPRGFPGPRHGAPSPGGQPAAFPAARQESFPPGGSQYADPSLYPGMGPATGFPGNQPGFSGQPRGIVPGIQAREGLGPDAGEPGSPRRSGLSPRTNLMLIIGAGVLSVVSVIAVILTPSLFGGSSDPGCKAYANTLTKAYNPAIHDLNTQAPQATVNAGLATAVTELTKAAGQAQSPAAKSALNGLLAQLKKVHADAAKGSVPASVVKNLNAAATVADNACR